MSRLYLEPAQFGRSWSLRNSGAGSTWSLRNLRSGLEIKKSTRILRKYREDEWLTLKLLRERMARIAWKLQKVPSS